MATEATRAGPRPTCARCLRPTQLCYCALVPTLEAQTRVVILQHPRERKVAIGTARMASLCVPSAELHVGARWSEARLARILGPSAVDAVLLYPGEGAMDVSELDARPRTLVVIDGTWSHTKGVVRDCPAIAALPRVSFVPRAPSEYRIRREPRADYVSTIEALVHVLGALEHDATRFTAMLEPFRAMVDAQIEHAARLRSPRIRRVSVVARAPRKAPATFRDAWDRLVCVAVEASAWSYGTPERARDPLGELVHVVIERAADGTRLDRVIAPERPLAPGTTTHTELDQDTIASGTSVAELASALRGVVRNGDILVHWGPHAPRLLAATGAWQGELLDLRHVLRVLESRRTGTVERACEERGLTLGEPGSRGRAGRRVAAILALARHLHAR